MYASVPMLPRCKCRGVKGGVIIVYQRVDPFFFLAPDYVLRSISLQRTCTKIERTLKIKVFNRFPC